MIWWQVDLVRVDLVKGSPNKLVKIACATALTCLKLIYLLPSDNSHFVAGVIWEAERADGEAAAAFP